MLRIVTFEATGKTVRVDHTIDLRRFPPIPRATKKFERLYDGHTSVERVPLDGEERQKQTRLDAVADEIKERFGTAAIRRGSSLRGEGSTTL